MFQNPDFTVFFTFWTGLSGFSKNTRNNTLYVTVYTQCSLHIESNVFKTSIKTFTQKLFLLPSSYMPQLFFYVPIAYLNSNE